VWFFAALLMPYKISVKEIAKTTHISYTTAFNLAKKLRRDLYLSQLQEKLKGIVELDEVYVNTGLKGKHGLQRPSRTRGLKVRGRGTYKTDKPPIMGMVERGGMVKLIPSANITGRTVLGRTMNNIHDEAEAIYTDEYSSYNALDGFCNHQTVNQPRRVCQRRRRPHQHRGSRALSLQAMDGNVPRHLKGKSLLLLRPIQLPQKHEGRG
jgi:transposase-like protein